MPINPLSPLPRYGWGIEGEKTAVGESPRAVRGFNAPTYPLSDAERKHRRHYACASQASDDGKVALPDLQEGSGISLGPLVAPPPALETLPVEEL